jgi:hypothetical protein
VKEKPQIWDLGINPQQQQQTAIYVAAQFDKSKQRQAKFILPSGDIPLVTSSVRRERVAPAAGFSNLLSQQYKPQPLSVGESREKLD